MSVARGSTKLNPVVDRVSALILPIVTAPQNKPKALDT